MSRSVQTTPLQRKKRYLGACDACKRRKVRCDGGTIDVGFKCGNCIAAGYECTHADLAKNPVSLKGYVATLEKRLEAVQQLLQKFVPGIDIEKELETTLNEPESNSSDSMPEDVVVRNDDDDVINTLDVKLRVLRIDPSSRRFFGKSSQYHLIQQVINQRASSVPNQALPNFQHHLLNWNQRREYWRPRPWLRHRVLPSYPESFLFPPEDLLPQLVDLYFEVVNTYEPLLHRPTFQNGLNDQLHLKNPEFAMLVLLVCAIGARYSDDDRVFLDNRRELPESAGAKWFDQVDLNRKDYNSKVSLCQLQCHVLSILYSQAAGLIGGVFVSAGHALRLAIDVGAHRKKPSEPTVTDELWKRAFWALLIFNHTVSAYNGLPVTLTADDYDQDYPLEVDDEYWFRGFQQPKDIPSKISYHVQNIKLFEILATALVKNYKVKKDKSTSLQQTLQELDSSINAWVANLPEYMRWDSARPNRHSAFIFTTFHYLQVFVHRPYIPTSKSQSPMGFPSLLIATSAARSIAKIVSNPLIRDFGLKVPLPLTLLATFSAGMILLLSTWSGKRAGAISATGPDMEHVYECMGLLKNAEKRFNWAALLWDILSEVEAAGDISPENSSRYPTDNSHQGWEFSGRSSSEGPPGTYGSKSSTPSMSSRLHSAPDLISYDPVDTNGVTGVHKPSWHDPAENQYEANAGTVNTEWNPPILHQELVGESYPLENQRALENALTQSYTHPPATWNTGFHDEASIFLQPGLSHAPASESDLAALYAGFPMGDDTMAIWGPGSNSFSVEWGAQFSQMRKPDESRRS